MCDISLPPMLLFVDCTQMRPPHLLAAPLRNCCGKDFSVLAVVPYLHVLGAFCSTELQGHTWCREHKGQPEECVKAMADSRLPCMLILAPIGPLAVFSAQPPKLPIAATCHGLSKCEGSIACGVKLCKDIRALVLEKSTAQATRTSRVGPCGTACAPCFSY